MIINDNVILFKEAAAAATSDVIYNNSCDTCYLTIGGTFTGANLILEGKANEDDDYVALAGLSVTDFTLAKNSFTASGIYAVDIMGVRILRARLTAISTGDITVSAQLIDGAGE